MRAGCFSIASLTMVEISRSSVSLLMQSSFTPGQGYQISAKASSIKTTFTALKLHTCMQIPQRMQHFGVDHMQLAAFAANHLNRAVTGANGAAGAII